MNITINKIENNGYEIEFTPKPMGDELLALGLALKNKVDRVSFKNLNKKEKDILKERLVYRKTLEEIGKKNKVSKQYIGQVEKKALEKVELGCG